MHHCLVCASSDFKITRYGNHLNKVRPRFLFLSYGFKIVDFLYRKVGLSFLKKTWLRLVFCRNSAPVLCCNACGFARYETSLNEHDLSTYYNELYHLIRGRKTRLDQLAHLALSNTDMPQRCIDQWQFITQHSQLSLTEDWSSLEIGAGYAGLSRLLKTQFPKSSPQIIDPNTVWKTYYRALGFHQIADSFPSALLKKSSYDIVFLSHVLEHVIDPYTFLQEIKSILIEKRFLFLEVPLCDTDYWNQDKIDGPHLSFFTEKSLISLLQSQGFTFCSIYSDPSQGFLRALAQSN